MTVCHHHIRYCGCGAELVLASSSAPAGLDVAWGALLEDIIGLWATGQPDKDDVLDLLAEYRAATRPAEDAGETEEGPGA